jgi:glucose/arabinose dehydrogenase
MGLPYSNHHAGQIYFGLTDGFLYFMMGDGGNSGDPWNFAQNKKSMLGKTLRLNVDVMPSMYSTIITCINIYLGLSGGSLTASQVLFLS